MGMRIRMIIQVTRMMARLDFSIFVFPDFFPLRRLRPRMMTRMMRLAPLKGRMIPG